MRRLVLLVSCCLFAVATAPQSAPQASSGADANYRIAGRVVDLLNGAPLSKVRVLVAPTGEGTQMHAFITSSDGRFWFDKLQAKKYSIIAERHGYPAQGYDSHEQYGRAIVTGPGQDTD